MLHLEQQLYTHSKTRKKTGKNQLKSTEISIGQHKTQTIEDAESDIDENDIAQNQLKKKRRRTKIRKNKNLTIATINVSGLKGKIKSLESLLESEKNHIALTTKTNLKEKEKVNIKGYKWIGKEQKRERRRWSRDSDSKKHRRYVVEGNSGEDHERLETKWIKLESRPKNISIGVFYGPQKSEKVEITREIYEKLENQMTQQLAENEMILGGDFNAKLKIEAQKEKQEQSRNGKILQELIQRKRSGSDHNKSWWRDMDKNWMEQQGKKVNSGLQYILTTRYIAQNVTYTIVDEEGGKKVCGNNKKVTDHNTLITNIKINNPRKKTFTKNGKSTTQMDGKNSTIKYKI